MSSEAQSLTIKQQTHRVNFAITNWKIGSLPGTFITSKPLALTGTSDGQPQLTWTLEIYPRGLSDLDSTPCLYLKLLPVPCSFPANNAVVQFRWEFKAYCATCCDNKMKTYMCTCQLFRSTEENAESSGGKWCKKLDQNGDPSLRITCSVSSFVFDSKAPKKTLDTILKCKEDFEMEVQNTQSLGFDLSAAFDSPGIEPVADLTVLFGDSRSLRVHKTILQMRSPVFVAMFSNEMLEQRTNELKLDDCCDQTAVTTFFRYLYSGSLKLPNSDHFRETLKELVYLANKYCVSCLLIDLQNCLLESIVLMREHLVLLTELAYIHSLTELKEKCVELARMGVFPNIDDKSEVDAFKMAVASHVQLAWDLLGLK